MEAAISYQALPILRGMTLHVLRNVAFMASNRIPMLGVAARLKFIRAE
jgi:hypothetical protein